MLRAPDSLIIIGSQLNIDNLQYNAISLSVKKMQTVHTGNINNAPSNFWSEACCFYIFFLRIVCLICYKPCTMTAYYTVTVYNL